MLLASHLTLHTSYLILSSSLNLILHIPHFELHHIKFYHHIIPLTFTHCLCMIALISFSTLYVINPNLSVGLVSLRALEGTWGFLWGNTEKSIKPSLQKFMSVIKLPAKIRTYSHQKNITESRIFNEWPIMSKTNFLKGRDTKKQENVIHRKAKENDHYAHLRWSHCWL